MISPWHNPLPLGEYTSQNVVVYFYNGRWVPITFYSLIEAITLCRKAESLGYELFVFPENLKPENLPTTYQVVLKRLRTHRNNTELH